MAFQVLCAIDLKVTWPLELILNTQPKSILSSVWIILLDFPGGAATLLICCRTFMKERPLFGAEAAVFVRLTAFVLRHGRK